MAKSHMLLGLFIVIILIAVIWYLNKNDNPIPNDGIVTETDDFEKYDTTKGSMHNRIKYMSDNIMDDLVSQCNTYSPSDPMTRNDFGPFTGYGKKRQLNFKNTEYPYSDGNDTDEDDEKVFTYKKKTFTKRTPEDIKDLFNVNKMLPQETEDWFDTVPLQHTKKINGTQLIDPKLHMGVNTIGSSLRNGTHDIRGDIPNPKITVSPWGNSTIEPDTNIKGLCNPI